MKTMFLVIALALGTASGAMAQSPLPDENGTPIPADELQKTLVGRYLLVGSDLAWYGQDGSYTLSNMMPGKYSIKDGTICVQFTGGGTSCDKFVTMDGHKYTITGNGRRFGFEPI